MPVDMEGLICKFANLGHLCSLSPIIRRALADRGRLVSQTTMNLFFTYREAFRAIAYESSMTSATVITWVDVLMAKLGKAIVIAAIGFSFPAAELPPGIQHFMQEDALRAAAQLPRKTQTYFQTCGLYSWHIGKWEDVASLLDLAEGASPGARRLAMRLMFATYIMSSSLMGSCNTKKPEYDSFSL